MLHRFLTIVACCTALSLGWMGAAIAIPPTPIEPPISEGPVQPPPTPIPAPAASMPVTLQLTKFICHNADEDSFFSNGDEPYLFVAAIYADGTTIQLGNLANATVRIQSPSKTHDNLGHNGVHAGNSFAIPSSTGHFSRSILPIGGLPESIGKSKSMVS